jgi:excisionase family DNA binding protein
LALPGNGFTGRPKEVSVSNDEILTLKQIAQLLKVADKTVYTMAQNNELPAFKVRGQWRFRRDDIDRWIDEQTEKAGGARLA